MIDKFDYLEPKCPLTGGKAFYYPQKDAPLGSIPVERVLQRVDACFDRNDYLEAGRLLEHWKNEAISLKDRQGQLAMESELVGYYRKQNDREKGLAAVQQALVLTEALGQGELPSGATILLNCATAYKAFGMAEQAMPLYRRAEEIYKSTLQPGDVRFGGLYNNMALALEDLQDFDGALAAYQQALSVMEQVPGGEADSAITYVNMAHLYEKWGQPEKIEGCMDTACGLLLTDSLPHNGYYAFVISKCAPSFDYFGYPDVCDILQQEAEEIYARN